MRPFLFVSSAMQYCAKADGECSILIESPITAPCCASDPDPRLYVTEAFRYSREASTILYSGMTLHTIEPAGYCPLPKEAK